MRAFLAFFCFMGVLFSESINLFRDEMGDLNYIETAEDRVRLNYCESHNPIETGMIPKRFHVIWLGSTAFPKESLKNLKSFAHYHPEWKFFVWTDQIRPELIVPFEMKLVTGDDLPHFGQEYSGADNEAERAALVRLEVLSKWGGVVIDHDVSCLGRFDPLHEKYAFYTSLHPLQPPIFSSSVSIAPHVLAAAPGHPLIARAIEETKKSWDYYRACYGGSDNESLIYRVRSRIELPLNEAFIGHLGPRDVIFPASQFHKMSRKSLADHRALQSWVNDPQAFLKKIASHLAIIEKRERLFIHSIWLLLGLHTLMLGLGLKKKKRDQHG